MPGGAIKVVKAISGRYLSGNGGRVVRLFGLFAADFIDHWPRRPMGNPRCTCCSQKRAHLKAGERIVKVFTIHQLTDNNQITWNHSSGLKRGNEAGAQPLLLGLQHHTIRFRVLEVPGAINTFTIL